MRIIEWLKSIRDRNRDKTDIFVSRFIATHKKGYKEYKKSLYRIKDGDGRAYEEIYRLFFDCLSDDTKRILTRLFDAFTGNGQRNKVKNILKIIEKDMSEELKALYACYRNGKTLAWKVKTNEVGVLTNEKAVRLSDYVIISDKYVRERWLSVPTEIRVYFKDQMSTFVDFLISNYGSLFKPLLRQRKPSVIEGLTNILKLIADYIIVVLFAGLPKFYENFKSMSMNGVVPAIYAYRFIRKDHGLMHLSEILSSFFREEAGTTGLYLIRNAMRYMAKYDINEGQTSGNDWVNMLAQPASESQAELKETLTCIVKCMKSKKGRKSADAMSLEEMLKEDVDFQKFMPVINSYIEKNSDPAHLAILLQLLQDNGFLIKKDDVEISDKSFILMLQIELNIPINEREFYKNREPFKTAKDGGEKKKNSHVPSEYYVIEDEWLPQFNKARIQKKTTH